MMATAAHMTIAEVDHIVPIGTLDADQIHTPGAFVKRIVQTVSQNRIEQRTVRK
jgi:3-oxoacid CoA-transferase subunit A